MYMQECITRVFGIRSSLIMIDTTKNYKNRLSWTHDHSTRLPSVTQERLLLVLALVVGRRVQLNVR